MDKLKPKIVMLSTVEKTRWLPSWHVMCVIGCGQSGDHACVEET